MAGIRLTTVSMCAGVSTGASLTHSLTAGRATQEDKPINKLFEEHRELEA